MSSRGKNYEYLIDEFPREKLKNRFLFFYEMAEIFIRDYKLSEYVEICSKSMMDSVIDYFADISRLKKFHNIERVNIFKIASYTAYWIYKRKPLYLHIQPPDEVVNLSPHLDDINSWFCCFIYQYMIYDRNEQTFRDSGEINKYKEFIKTLNYYFSHRTVTPQALELAILGLEASPSCSKYSTNPLDIKPVPTKE